MLYREHIRYSRVFRSVIALVATFLFAQYVMPVFWAIEGQQTWLNTMIPVAIFFAVLYGVTSVSMGMRIHVTEQSTIHGSQHVLRVRGNRKYERTFVLCRDIVSAEVVEVDHGYLRTFLMLGQDVAEGYSLIPQAGYRGTAVRLKYRTHQGEIGLQFPTRRPDELLPLLIQQQDVMTA